MSDPKFKIAFLIYPEMTQLDFSGPAEVLGMMPDAEVTLVWKSIEPVRSDIGITFLPTATIFDDVAYDMICPANDCNSAMSFERGIVLKCKCDGSEYGVGKGIGGAPQTDGFTCPAIEYNVTKNGSAIRISIF